MKIYCNGCGKEMRGNGGLSTFWHDECVARADKRGQREQPRR